MSESVPEPESLLKGLSAKELLADIMQPTQPGDNVASIPPLTPEELAPISHNSKSSNASAVAAWAWFTRRGRSR